MWEVILVFFIKGTASFRSAQLKGNLLFETEQQSPVTINPQYVQFNRQFDLSNIKTSLDLLDNYTLSYYEYCDDITKDRKRVHDIYQAKGDFFNGHETCRLQGGYLPEIRNEEEADKFVGLMRVIPLKEIPAGLSLTNDSNIIFSRTGEKNSYPRLKQCPKCDIISNNKAKLFVNKYEPKSSHNLVYAIDERTDKLYIKNSHTCANSLHMCAEGTVLCTKGSEFDSNIINTMVTHSCKRDTIFMTETNKFLRAEYESFVHPMAEKNSIARRRRAAVSVRKKRFVPAIPWISGGLMGGGVMASAISNVNPFHFIGEVVGGVFGLATKKDLKITHEMIKSLSFELEAVKINQRVLVEACNGLMEHAQKIEQMVRFQAHDIAVLYGELDSKVAMRYLQSVIQMTLLKIHGSILSARQYKPSPYVFGAKDLSAVALSPTYNQRKLSNKIDDVAMALAITENEYTFLIAVPIVDQKTQFQTFLINKLPIVHQGKTYIPQTQHQYYGINLPTNEYIILTGIQYQSCINQPICSAPSPIFSINSKSPCEINTFTKNTALCPLEVAPPAGPTFFNFGNTTFYSVSEITDIHVRCVINGKLHSRHEKIDGIGSFQAHTGCITQVSESAQVRPIHVAEIHDLASDSIFGLLKQFDSSAVTYPPEPNLNLTTSQKPITILEVQSFSEGLKLLFDVDTDPTDVARVFVVIFLFIILFLLVYGCSASFRLWLNTCCLQTKPGKYWSKQYGNVPEFIRIKPRANAHLQEKFQAFAAAIRKPFQTKTVVNPTSETVNFDDNSLQAKLNNTHNML